MNQNWKISTTAIKNIKNINNLKKGVLIKYIPRTIPNPKSSFKLNSIKSEVNIKPILDYIKMRIEFLKIEHACVYEPETGTMVSACCICLNKINKNNYVCTSTSCISEFLKELTNDNTHLSGKHYESYPGYLYDYDAYNGHADCMDVYEEEYHDEYPCMCVEKAGYNIYGACNDCGTCRCGGCIDMCRCLEDDYDDYHDDDDYRGGF